MWIIEDITGDRSMLEALARSTSELSAIFNSASLGIAVVREHAFARCNRRLEDILGLPAGSMLGRPIREMFGSEDEFQRIDAQVRAEFLAGTRHRREQMYLRADGKPVWLRVSGSTLDPANLHAGSVWLVEDITAVREAEERAQQAFDEQQMIFDNAAVGILFARDRVVQSCNRKLAEIFGYQPDELAGRSTRILYLSEGDYQGHGARISTTTMSGETYIGEIRARHKDGHPFWVRATGRRVTGETRSIDMTWIFEDVTERHQAEEALLHAHDELEQRVVERTAELASANTQLQEEVFERMQAEQRTWHIAHHDSLTGLPNRTLLHDRLQQALTQAQRGRHRVAVMFLDLDRFKSVNDTLGHAIGDELLKHVADRLRRVVRAVDTVSRLGGDEFVIVLHEMASPDDVVQVAEKIIGAMAPPVHIDGHQLRADDIDRHQHVSR